MKARRRTVPMPIRNNVEGEEVKKKEEPELAGSEDFSVVGEPAPNEHIPVVADVQQEPVIQTEDTLKVVRSAASEKVRLARARLAARKKH